MQNVFGKESSKEGGPHKRRRVIVYDGSEDDSEDEFLSSSPRPVTTQNRPKVLSGAGKKVSLTICCLTWGCLAISCSIMQFLVS